MERASELLGKLAAEESLILTVFGGPRKKSQPVRKVSLRPVLLKDALHYQAEYTYEKRVTHENLLPEEVEAFAERQLQSGFKQADIFSTEADYTVLANKPDHEKILKKKPTKTMGPLAHNREKNYAIPDGKPVDFLVHLGVQTRDGQIVPKHRNKFRQINRFLEIAEDCLEYLPKEPVIIDFGCGKSYLTFALYWYLNVKNDYKAKLVGLDLK
ncbi:MAG: methyltransferase, partial [Firmicutes bacterium]|nr:methyltransferase [Bacillota bacterium]